MRSIALNLELSGFTIDRYFLLSRYIFLHLWRFWYLLLHLLVFWFGTSSKRSLQIQYIFIAQFQANKLKIIIPNHIVVENIPLSFHYVGDSYFNLHRQTQGSVVLFLVGVEFLGIFAKADTLEQSIVALSFAIEGV